MAKGIEISIAANTRDFQKGTKDVEKGLERVQDSLEDLSRVAQQDGDKIGDNLGALRRRRRLPRSLRKALRRWPTLLSGKARKPGTMLATISSEELRTPKAA
jgi:hypothetical protein